MSKNEEIGSMCVILHRERSFHNIDIRILKSALQKYARRGMFTPKGIWCLIELDLFSLLEINPKLILNCQLTLKQIQQNSIRIRSNMINRMIAMMSEDIGPCNTYLPNQIHNLYLKWIQTRREYSSRKILFHLYYLLANENISRIRLLSDLRTVYFLPEYLTEKKILHQELLKKFQMEELIEIMYGNECRGKKNDEIYEKMLEHLSNKSELAYAYLSILFQRNDQSFIQQKFWPYLIRTSPFPDSTRSLAFFYKTLKHKEHYLYLYHAMALIIYQDQIKKIDKNLENFIDIDVEQIYEEHMKNELNIEFDSFVFDRHTGAKTSRSDFALEGARVKNECQELYNDKYRQMYNDFKILIDQDEEQKKRKYNDEKISRNKKQKISNNNFSILTNDQLDNEIIRLGYHLDIKDQTFIENYLSKLPHGQRRTSIHKKAVFISSDYIYKGPYLSNSLNDIKKFLNNLYFTRALIYLEEFLKLSEQYRTIVDWNSIIKIENTNEYYLKQISLGNLMNIDNDREIVTTKIEKNVEILRRGSHIHRLIEYENDDINYEKNFQNLFQTIIQHFYLRYLLNIGDSGTWNILVRQDQHQRICGIDFEEIRSNKHKTTTNPLMMIMSKVSKRQQQFYQSYTNQIEIFSNPIDPSSELAQTLSISFKINIEDFNQRIEDYAKAIKKN